MATTAKICGSDNCTWLYTPTGWIVTATTCKGGCGCSAATSFPAGTKFDRGGIPHDPVPHWNFANEVNDMLKDPALPAHFQGQIKLDPNSPPVAGTPYLMPCVN